jgi:putative Mg2+ transporter-C (MgtC) family protein
MDSRGHRLAVGGGLYVEAIAATIIILVILAGIKPLEKWYQRRNQALNMRLKVDTGKMSLDILNSALGFRAQRISRYISVPSSDPSIEEVNITIKRLSADDMTDIIRKLAALPNVREAVKVSDSN